MFMPKICEPIKKIKERFMIGETKKSDCDKLDKKWHSITDDMSIQQITNRLPMKMVSYIADLEEKAAVANAFQISGHLDDMAVDFFAATMKTKLAQKRSEGRCGWHLRGDCSQEFLSKLLRDHVEKGDPIDVANFCMMLFNRGERILKGGA